MARFWFIFVNVGFILTHLSAQDVPVVRHHAVKATFLSWFSGSGKISYERAVFRRQTIEFTAGYIGIGHDKYKNNPAGYTVRYAHKFILSGNKTQPLNGLYLRPEWVHSKFRYDLKENRGRALSDMKSLLFTFGYQYAMHRFIIDGYFGGGYAWGKEADTHYQHGFSLWDYFGTYRKNIAMTFGIKLGISF
jgi:hypothetical protein